MFVCATCKAEIIRPGVSAIAGVSHGMCLGGFVARFKDVESETLTQLASSALKQLPMGGILLDQSLRVVGYNEAESRIAGLARDKVMRRDFFVDIAPCMAAAAVGEWCRDHVNGETILRKDVD